MLDGNGGEFRVNDDAYTYPNEEAIGYFDPSYDAYDANLEEAIALLTEAGYEFNLFQQEVPHFCYEVTFVKG